MVEGTTSGRLDLSAFILDEVLCSWECLVLHLYLYISLFPVRSVSLSDFHVYFGVYTKFGVHKMRALLSDLGWEKNCDFGYWFAHRLCFFIHVLCWFAPAFRSKKKDCWSLSIGVLTERWLAILLYASVEEVVHVTASSLHLALDAFTNHQGISGLCLYFYPVFLVFQDSTRTGDCTMDLWLGLSAPRVGQRNAVWLDQIPI